MNEQRALLGKEWQTLQTQVEHSERQLLWVKLFAVLLVVIVWPMGDRGVLLGIVLLAVLWLQNAIYATFQARMVARLEAVEAAFVDGDGVTPFQLNTQWQQQRPGQLGLIAQYACHALRPTVAFPYLVLLVLMLLRALL